MDHFFFFNDTATTEIYTLSLHDALPIWSITPEIYPNYTPKFWVYKTDLARAKALLKEAGYPDGFDINIAYDKAIAEMEEDRKSTRLNSSHLVISYAVFCLKKKKHLLLSDLQVAHVALCAVCWNLPPDEGLDIYPPVL